MLIEIFEKKMNRKLPFLSTILATSVISGSLIPVSTNASYSNKNYSKSFFGETVKLGDGGVKTFGTFSKRFRTI